MNIQTIANNLRNTIAGKEQMLATLQRRVSIERTPIDQAAFIAVINFLEINIDELKRILQDIEQCESSLPGEGGFQSADDHRLQQLERQASYTSWETNPDRMGGCYAEDELRESGWK